MGFKGKFNKIETGKPQSFNGKIDGFPVNVPLNQSIDTRPGEKILHFANWKMMKMTQSKSFFICRTSKWVDFPVRELLVYQRYKL